MYGGEILGGRGAVVDRHSRFGRMQLRHLDRGPSGTCVMPRIGILVARTALHEQGHGSRIGGLKRRLRKPGVVAMESVLTAGGVVTGTFVCLTSPHFAGYITSKTADTGATGVNQIEYIEKVSRDLIFTY